MNKEVTEEYCCVCGEKHDSTELKKVEIKGEKKKICDECAETIHGLV